jgi:3-methyladenine DNA glycosylase/8-oxoguanine DNA glycosylase
MAYSILTSWEYHPFHTLVISIISQQLSAKAADTIENCISEIVSVPSLDSNTDRFNYRCRLYRPGVVAVTPS